METYKLGDKRFEPAFRHQDQETARQAIEGAYLEWVDQIETSRVETLRRLDTIERNQIHCERSFLLPEADTQSLARFKNDLDDEEERFKRQLEDEETQWKQRHGVEVLRDGRSHHLVAFYEGGSEADLRWVQGYVGPAITAVKDAEVKKDGRIVETVKVSTRFL